MRIVKFIFFALPAIASSLIGSVYNIVDQIFIGQKIGTLGNAAANVAFPLVMLMVTFSILIGVGAELQQSKFPLISPVLDLKR